MFQNYSKNCETGSIKDLNRASYSRRIANQHKAARRPFKNNKVWKHSQQWKESFKITSDSQMDVIYEQSFQPHFGMESLTSVSFAVEALAKFANIDVPDKVLREVEGTILLLVNLSQQSTTLGAVTSVLTWVQGRVSKSLFKTVKDFIEEILVSPQSDSTPDWLLCLRDIRQNWQLCKGNRAFKQVSKLLGCLVMLGLCDAAQLTFSVGQFKIFAPDLCEKHMTAFDVADALFETVVFFTEGAYLCFQTGSLKPLLINDRTAMELDTEYAQVSAWFDLVRNGNLQKFAGMSDQEFERRLNTLSGSLINLSMSLKGLDKKLVLDKVQRILQMQNDFISLKIACGVRHSPWAVSFFGESSQGKTTICDQLLDAVMVSQDLPTDKKYRCAYNPSDKFMSNWTSDKLVLLFDDVANEKSQFIERPPTRAIVDIVNNQMFYAPKAEIEAKGKCFVEPWLVAATTNKKDMDAGVYSNCPYSIQRRLTVITVKAKPEFQRMEDGIPCGIDPSKVRAHYTTDEGVYDPPPFDDIWSLTIEKAVKPQDLRTVAGYAPVEWNGKKLVDISMAECIQWAVEDFNEHRKNQAALLEGMHKRLNLMQKCGVDGCIHIKGNCPTHHEPQFGKETVAAFRKLFHSTGDPKSIIEGIYDRVDYDASRIIYDHGMRFLSSWDWIKVLPSGMLCHRWAPSVFRWLYRDKIELHYEKESKRLWSTLIFSLICIVMFCGVQNIIILSFFSILQYLRVQRQLVDRVEHELYENLRKRNWEIAPILRRYREKYTKYICGFSVGIAALYGLARAYRSYRANEQTVQGSLEPKTQQEITERDGEINVWTDVVKRELPMTETSKRMSADHLENIVTKALLYGSIHRDDGNGMVNGLMLSSNVILIPDHYFNEFGDQLDCTFRKKNPDATGGKFAARIHIKYTYLIPNSDLRVCYIPNGGSFKNLVNFFPTEEMPSVPFRMRWRKKDGEMIVAKGITVPGIVSTWKSFKGGAYKNLTINTFDGLCGATLVSDTNGSVILGVHLGGTADTPVGVFGSLTQQELFTAFAELRKMEGVVLSGEAGKFETTVLGVQVLRNEPLHKKSALNYLPENSQIEYYGSCPGRAVTKSDVKVTPISTHIVDVCGVPNIFRGPKLNPDWYGWQTCLANLAVPAHPYPHDLLELAIKDYKEPLIDIFKSALWRCARPLSDRENLCGIPGKKFMDAIKLDTSVGFPLSGPKRDHVIELEPTEEWPNNRELEKVLMDEINRVEDCYRRGERGYPIAKACKKDEILAKEKCRIFYGNALSLTYLIRKYYLPLLRVLQMNPLVSECAVGINSHGPEWQQFHEHVMKFGEKRIFGGDYGKYDQKLPSQLIFAALRILMDFARVCDYNQEDLTIMEAMTGDIVFAYIAFNGDLIGLTEGTHISGNSLTVIINGICGSLNLRCFFYSQYPSGSFENRLRFRDCVAAMTYGDDNIGSVRDDIHNFTIKGCSKFLEQYGQVYTMPDKESELLDFLPPEEFEFLKRKSVWHPKLGVHVGALLDKSIYKSLHCFMRGKNSPLTEEHACAINIDGALREWFNHGEDKYEKQRLLMKEVANRAGVSHMCTGLDLSYNDRVSNWVATYGADRPCL
uniref:SF3 helicase domain-containing protein n=1 Tax=Wenzhou picorna-like virus 8 TaxID=1923645 RepID=A0A1L3KGW8_9VIRU|nr:hypothetical protein 1 [Wenzhou picorna-like virus 8]